MTLAPDPDMATDGFVGPDTAPLAEGAGIEITASYATMAGCGCPICGAPEGSVALPVPDGTGLVQLDEQGFLLDVSNPASGLVGTTMENGLRILSAIESAAQITRPAGTWADFTAGLEVTYSISADGVAEGMAFDADYQAVTRRIFDFYAEISGLTFREIPAGSTETPNIKMYNIDQYGGGGWAGYPGAGTIESGIGRPWTPGDVYEGSYVYMTILHEVGHLLGLAHPGNYNGSVNYLTDAVFWNDSLQYSVMSYMGEDVTGGWFRGSPATPMLFDILAIQMEYGANYSTRSGNTVYGYNSNAGQAAYRFDEADNTSAFSIWDGGGRDRLDFSGFVGDTVMDLREGGFSSTGIETYNVSIAYGAVIEDATAGSGNDRMRGNDVANLLIGGRGHDVIYCGADTLPTGTPDPRAFAGILMNDDPMERGQYLSATNVTGLSGTAFTIEMMVNLTRIPATIIPFLSYAVPGNSNELLIEGGRDSTLRLIIDGQTRYDTPILTRSLADGLDHRLSVTWNAATGEVAFYIDGALAHQGIYAAAQGRSLSAGGTLVIGQEQDQVGGAFNSREVLQGAAGDIRIFDNQRSAAQIMDHRFTPLTGAEEGLMHNWQVQATDTTVVTDVALADPPVDLTDLLPAGSFVASQSSTYTSSMPASNVLDDDTATQNHTKAGPSEWLLVTFAEAQQVTHVDVQNITGWGSRLNGAVVSVLDDTGAVVHTWPAISGEGYYGSNLTFRLPVPTMINAVRIDHQNQNLHVAEINVFGHAPAGVEIPPEALRSDLTVHGGAVVVMPEAAMNTGLDHDTLHGGEGRDSLFGGAGNDWLIGDDDSYVPPAADDIALVRLNGGTAASGTTDHWLDQTAAMPMPTGPLTVEMIVRLDANGANGATLFGYGSSNDSSTPRFTMRAWSDYWDFYVNGARFDSVLPAGALTSTEARRLSISWNGGPDGDGTIRIYVDGVLADEGTIGAGVSVPANQQFWVMSGNGSILQGAVGDIRIWNGVRSAAEIAADAFVTYDSADGRAGLVANWQVDGETGTLTNIAPVSGAADLEVQNITPDNPLAFETAAFSTLADDVLTGGLGHDVLKGGAGADRMIGGAGNDRYYIDNPLDRIEEAAGEGIDTAYTSVSYTLAEGVALEWLIGQGTAPLHLAGNGLNNIVQGSSGDDSLFGHDGNDSLNGGTGADLMSGGAGNDTYVVDDAGDIVLETTGQEGDEDAGGNDLIKSAISLDLGSAPGLAFVERLTLTTVQALVGIGNDLSNTLIGNRADNTLNGGRGNDLLRGGTGADLMIGGQGNDRFIIDNALDRIEESAGEGIDTAYTVISYALAEGVDVERMIGQGTAAQALTGNSLHNNLFGGAGDDSLYGMDGNDTLTGGTGADLMAGGAGNDTYIVDDAGDIVLESTEPDGATDAGGNDLVKAGVSFDLGATAGLAFVERLILTGNGAIDATGNDLANTLTGNGAANRMNGGLGNDVIVTGGGADTIVFNTAPGPGNIDRLLDYNPVLDSIHLDGDVFVGLAPGALDGAAFAANLTGQAITAAERILLETDTGRLFFDSDGLGGAARVQFATVNIGTTLTAADFLVV